MKKTMIATLIALSVGLTACDDEGVNAPTDAVEKAVGDNGVSVVRDAKLSKCPANQVLADVSAFTLDVPQDAETAEAFHAALATQDGVVTTDTGLQYSVVQSGNPQGPNPLPVDTVEVNYHGLFPNGDVFDSSFMRGEPTSFPLNRVIKGWTEGVGLMRPCDAWTFYIPSDLAYGPRGRPGIPGGASLVFHVQLLDVQR